MTGTAATSDLSLDDLWDGFSRGDARARERLLALHYDEFRRVARRVLNGDAVKLQMQPTDLAHEAAIRVMKLDRVSFRDRAHFLALSARVMRQVLLDEVRRHRAAKRQPPVITLFYDPDAPSSTPPAMDMEAFDEALKRLFAVDEERARIVELRFYAGLTLEEIAGVQEQSLSTVKRRWRAARAWLAAELGLD